MGYGFPFLLLEGGIGGSWGVVYCVSGIE